jgi:ADP-ribose pyrophosphatase
VPAQRRSKPLAAWSTRARTAAQRELLEETGYGGGEWTYLGAVQPNPAIHDNLCHHWLGQGVELVAEPEPGAGEHIRVELMTDDEVVASAQSGEIQHALALSVIGRVLDVWERPTLGEQVMREI